MKSVWLRRMLLASLVVPACISIVRGADAPASRSGIDTSGFDKAVRPQDDFFRYVNGSWIKRTEIPPDKPMFGTVSNLRDKSEAALRAILEEAAADTSSPAGSEVKKIGDLYAAFMDEARAESLGQKPIEADFAHIDAIADKTALIKTLAAFQREGLASLFRAFVNSDAKQSDRNILYLNQGGISLPDESFYRDAKFEPVRTQYVAHIEKMLKLAGIPEPKQAAAKVMDLESRLAKHHWDRVKSRDQTLIYNKRSRKALDELAPGFDWSAWFTAFGVRRRAT